MIRQVDQWLWQYLEGIIREDVAGLSIAKHYGANVQVVHSWSSDSSPLLICALTASKRFPASMLSG